MIQFNGTHKCPWVFLHPELLYFISLQWQTSSMPHTPPPFIWNAISKALILVSITQIFIQYNSNYFISSLLLYTSISELRIRPYGHIKQHHLKILQNKKEWEMANVEENNQSNNHCIHIFRDQFFSGWIYLWKEDESTHCTFGASFWGFKSSHPRWLAVWKDSRVLF